MDKEDGKIGIFLRWNVPENVDIELDSEVDVMVFQWIHDCFCKGTKEVVGASVVLVDDSDAEWDNGGICCRHTPVTRFGYGR